MKKLRTRRQIALRRILAAMLCLLVLVGFSVLRKLPYLSPSSAIAAAEQDLACGPTEVLAQRQEGETTFLLSWNDQVLLANMVSPAFWRGHLLPGQPLYCADRTRDAQQGIEAAGFRFYNQDTRQGWGQWAGLVSGWPEAVSVRLTGPEAPEPMEAALQPTGEGDRYFWVHHPYTGEALCPSYTQITLLDAAGHALTTSPITNPEHFTIISPSQGVVAY